MNKDVVVMTRGRKYILVVKFEGMKGKHVYAYDLKGKQYSLELDYSGFNGKTGKTYFDYYLNNSYLPTLEEYCKLNGLNYEEIRALKYKEMEELINVKHNVMAVPKQTPYVVEKSEAENLIQSTLNRKVWNDITESAKAFEENNLVENEEETLENDLL